jgi:transposase
MTITKELKDGRTVQVPVGAKQRRLENQAAARELRGEGYALWQIAQALGKSPETIRLWTKHVARAT